jgi:glycosyltransferase involved in cell wall biosynthesis
MTTRNDNGLADPRDANICPALTLKAAHWMNVVTHLDPRYGGLSSVVPQLGSAIAVSGLFSVDLAAFCDPDEIYSTLEHPKLALTHWPTSRTIWLQDRELRARFREEVKRADGIHIHGLWEHSTAIACHTARALRTPYILSAHGMLQSWALANKKLKKRIYSALFERANVNGAACLHALTHAEAQDYRRFGSSRPIAVIPNGVHIPGSVSPELFYTQFPALKGKRIILFLGRIHFKKGLDLLVKSWATLAKKWPEAHLVLAGPDFENTRSTVEQLIAERGISDQVLLTGMLPGEMKWSALAAAQCFVLPSYSEGLSVSILEALGIGLPVIITEQCNLPDVKLIHAGWCIQPDVDQLSCSISEFLNNSPEANREIGARGRNLILKRYNWTSVANQMSDLYRWVQGGPFPLTVDLVMQ